MAAKLKTEKKILFLLSKWFQTRRFLWEFPIGSYVKLSLAVVAISILVVPPTDQDGCTAELRLT
jgi:hypothetical protein